MDLLTAQSKEELLAGLRPFGQQHLLDFWDELDPAEKSRLAQTIAGIDFASLNRVFQGAEDVPDWPEIARRARPPRSIRLASGENEFTAAEARECGEGALRSGRVAFILVAGGEGTRLGFSQPKGLFPIGPVSQRTLIQVIVDKLRAVARRYTRAIPLYLMTSPATHDVMSTYFADHSHLGLNKDDVHIFCQGTLPAVDRVTGKVLLSDRGAIAMSPDGHGGMLAALSRTGCLEEARNRGVELFFYGQVDNPLLTVCDPEFLGYHLLAKSEMTTQVVQKRFPLERVGNVVDVDGQSRIIEYIDLPEDAAHSRNEDDSLRLWAGNTAVHVFDAQFLAQAATNAGALPVHRALKKVPYIDASGKHVQPLEPNALKFERFIFDLLPFARRTFVVEVDSARAFAPVKNATGEAVDTPETAKAAMILHDAEILRGAGAVVPEDVAVEVNPLWALDSQEAAAKFKFKFKIPDGIRITGPTYFS